MRFANRSRPVRFLECPRQLLSVPIALTVVGSLKFAAVDGYEFTTKQVQVLAEQRKCAADLLKWLKIILAEVSNRFEDGGQLFQQPSDANMPLPPHLGSHQRNYLPKFGPN